MERVAFLTHVQLGSPFMAGKYEVRHYGTVEIDEKLLDRWRLLGFTRRIEIRPVDGRAGSKDWIAVGVA